MSYWICSKWKDCWNIETCEIGGYVFAPATDSGAPDIPDSRRDNEISQTPRMYGRHRRRPLLYADEGRFKTELDYDDSGCEKFIPRQSGRPGRVLAGDKMTTLCKWCPHKDCDEKFMASCRRKKQLDFYENFFKEEYKDMGDALVEIDKKKEEGTWTAPKWE